VVTFHKLSDSASRVSVQLDWAPEDLVEKAGALLGIDRASENGDLENFKTFIGEQGTEQGAWQGDVSN
jgi:hypothetical protein